MATSTLPENRSSRPQPVEAPSKADWMGLASPLGPVRRFNLAHPKLLIP
jgi:hypothetical protein